MTNIYHFSSFLWARNSGGAELGGSGWKSFMRLRQDVGLRLCAAEGLTGLEDLLPRWLTDMTGKLVPAVGRPQFPATRASPEGCWTPSSGHSSCFLQSEWSKSVQGGNYKDFYDLATEDTLHCVCNILLVIDVRPVPRERGSPGNEYQESYVIGSHLGDWSTDHQCQN